MSRKVPSFEQLINYMDAGASSRSSNIYHNLYSQKSNDIHDSFLKNSHFLKRRKNGVYMYHEVISITRSDQISAKEQITILRKVIHQYINSRAKDNLVYGVLHDDKIDNLHYHLLISSNHLESSKRHRLSKTDFDTIKRNVEIYVLERYPELNQKKLISKERTSKDDLNSENVSSKGQEMKRRTGKTPDRERIKKALKRIFGSVTSHAELIELLELEGMKLYKRGKNFGIVDEPTKRKHRFQALGLSNDYEALEKRIATIQSEAKESSDTEKVSDSPDEAIDESKQAESSEKISEASDLSLEQAKRLEDMEAFRKKEAERKANLHKKR